MSESERQLWLAERKKGLGGSDVAAVLGLSPWKTAYDVWLDKTGRTEKDDISNVDAVYWGNVLEDVVAREYARRLEVKVQRMTKPIEVPGKEWMRGNVDRLVVAEGSRARLDKDGRLQGAVGGLECKTASAYASKDWQACEEDDGIPIHYACQCAWYMGIAGLPWWDIAALIGGQKFLIRRIEHDAEVFRHISERCEEFWLKNVVEDIEPEPQNTNDIIRMFPGNNGELIDIDNEGELLEAVNAARTAKAQISELEKELEAATDRLKMAIAGSDGLALSGKPVATWKKAKDSQKTDWQALAMSLNPAPEIIQKHTTIKPGSRRFLLK